MGPTANPNGTALSFLCSSAKTRAPRPESSAYAVKNTDNTVVYGMFNGYEYGVKLYSMVYSMGIFNMVWSGCGVKLYIMLWVFYAILMALLVLIVFYGKFKENLRK